MKKKLFILLILTMSLCAVLMSFSACALEDEHPETGKIYLTIRFNGNGGTLVSGKEEQIVKSISEVEYPTYEREGYDFVGWDQELTFVKKDTTIKALWEKQTIYTVIFDGNGGSLLSGESKQNVVKGKDAVAPTFIRAGYDFIGWDSEFTNITSNKTIKALWEKQPVPTYTVVFLGGGGTLVSGSECQIVGTASEIVAPVYKRSHYVFAGWDYPLDTVTGDMVITALWKKEEYTVSFNLSSIAYPEQQSLVNGLSHVESVKVKYGESLGDKLPEFTPIDDEYEKFGWIYVNSNGIKNLVYSTTVISDDLFGDIENLQIELIAEIKEKSLPTTSFTVTFDGNGGTLVMGSVTQLVESATELVEPIFEREGYTFIGWSEILSDITSDKMVYAKWQANKYDVKFYLDCFVEGERAYSLVNGRDTVFDIFVSYGGTLGERLYEFEPKDSENYKVVGWKYTPIQGKEFIVTGDTVFNKDTFGDVEDMVITLKAQLASNTFEVIFDGNGGTLFSGNAVQQIRYGSYAVAPTFKKEGFAFVRWDKELTNITKDTTIKAIWRPLQYVVKFNLTCYGLDGEEVKSTLNGKTSVEDAYVNYGDTFDFSNYQFVPVNKEDYSRRGWAYILSDGTKKYVDNDTVFTEEFFSECEENEIVLVAQTKSHWTPIIPI